MFIAVVGAIACDLIISLTLSKQEYTVHPHYTIQLLNLHRISNYKLQMAQSKISSNAPTRATPKPSFEKTVVFRSACAQRDYCTRYLIPATRNSYCPLGLGRREEIIEFCLPPLRFEHEPSWFLCHFYPQKRSSSIITSAPFITRV